MDVDVRCPTGTPAAPRADLFEIESPRIVHTPIQRRGLRGFDRPRGSRRGQTLALSHVRARLLESVRPSKKALSLREANLRESEVNGATDEEAVTLAGGIESGLTHR